MGNIVKEGDVLFKKNRLPYNYNLPEDRGKVVDNEGKIQERNAYRAEVDSREAPPPDKSYNPADPPPRRQRIYSNVMLLPRHNYIPENGHFFDQYAQASIPATGVKTTVISFTVPVGHEGYLVKFGQDVGVLTDWNTTTWYLEVGGSTVPPYGAISRQVGTLTEMTECLKYVDENDIIILSAKNSSAAVNAWGRIKGWYYPKPKSDEKGFK